MNRALLGMLSTSESATGSKYPQPHSSSLSVNTPTCDVSYSVFLLAWASSVEERSFFLAGLLTWEVFDPVRTDARFDRVLERLGLAAYLAGFARQESTFMPHRKNRHTLTRE